MSKKVAKTKILAALRQAQGFIAVAARQLEMSRGALSRRIHADPDLVEALRDSKETHLDLAESKLLKAVNEGEAWAICFYLKTQGKARGYVERQQLDHRIVDEQKLDEEIERELAILAGERAGTIPAADAGQTSERPYDGTATASEATRVP